VKNGFVASLRGSLHDHQDFRRLGVLPVEGGWSSEVISGFVSPVYGKKEIAPVIRGHSSIKLPIEHSTLLVPLGRTGDQCGRFTRLPVQARAEYVTAYEYASAPKTHRVFFAPTRTRPWQFGQLETDASILYCGLENGSLLHLVVCEASVLKMNGQLAFAYDEKIERMECVLRDRHWQTFGTCDLPVQTCLQQATIS
jgi:hypothetical protein